LKQLSFIETDKSVESQEWGTFKDSLRAPIHNWFTYPAGFSYKAVESSIQTNNIRQGQTIYDPFMGSGTTNLVAKKLAINSYGVEAHPFVFRITRTKMNWEIDGEEIAQSLREVETQVRNRKRGLNGTDVRVVLEKEFPELVLKCYENSTLLDLLFIRNAATENGFSQTVKDIFFVGLTSILRQVSTAATGWPYIAPNKQKTTSLNKNALYEFARQVRKMLSDIRNTVDEASPDYRDSFHKISNADSRHTQDLIPSSCVDHVFTSPPYLNNFDYADRTRLELYFWGEAKNWSEISENIRAKLITSATTQISRDDPRYKLSKELQEACPDVFDLLKKSVSRLSEIRLTRGGKKSYDHLVSGYFNDMFQIISEVYRVLKHDTKAVFVLGDSAPYGVHVPTDDLIGKIGLGIGFSDYCIDVLRERGGKWKDNPQRHDVLLRESIVTLTKG
jgi:DNA modification methylase